MNDITLQQLRYFLAAVEHGSLSAAAEAQFIAQPSLSEQIRRLEKQLGIVLFTRTNRKLMLTEAAETLIPHARRVVAAAEAATASVGMIRTMTGGTVSFGTFSSAHHLLNTQLVKEFHALHPLVSLRLLSLNSVQVADGIRAGDLEAGLIALPIDDRGLEVGPPQWTAEAVYLSADPKRVRRPLSIQQVAEAALILPEVRWGDTDPFRRKLLGRAQLAGLTIKPVIEVESQTAALALAAEGIADTAISLPLAQATGYTDTLSWNSFDPPLVETYAFATRRDSELSPATKVLMRLASRILHDWSPPPRRSIRQRRP